MASLLIIIFSLIIPLFSIVLHELSHGVVAYYLGDPTAKYAGRLTLNPLSHLDLWGSFLVPLFLFILTAGNGPIFGWAKPVPVNPYNFRDQKWGEAKVALAGPLTNIALGFLFVLFVRLFPSSPFLDLLSLGAIYNFLLAFFNLLPIPPLDGYHIIAAFFPFSWRELKFFLEEYGMIILLIIIFFGPLNWLFWLADKFYYFLLK